MRRSDFHGKIPGRLVDITGGHVAFIPQDLPPQLNWDAKLAKAVSDAERALGQLAGTSRTLTNPHLLIRPFLQKEAVLSSRIEGTRATLSDLLLFDIEMEREAEIIDTREVSNYVVALETGLDRIKTIPIGTRVIRELHAILLRGVRGGESASGEYRTLQVHIGPTKRIEDATFIPPPANEIDPLMSRLEQFIHERNDLPALVRFALIHYQFEAIHPFYDGNGRVGRLLISLLLSAEQILDQPLLYLSAYFERHRDRYYSALRRVSTHGAWTDWVYYFLEGVQSQSFEAIDAARRLLALRDVYHRRLQTARSSALIHKLIDDLFLYPAMSATRAAKLLGVTWRAAQQNIEKLVDANILREVTGQKRNRIFLAEELVRSIEA